MFEDKIFKYWEENLSEEFFDILDKKLQEFVKDEEHRKSKDPYHIGNIILCLEFTELPNTIAYLFHKYGAEFIQYIQNHFILDEGEED